MISDELFKRYHINKERFLNDQEGLYRTFLIQTDFICNKIIEAQYQGITLSEDYSEIIEARKYARSQINLLENHR